MGLAIGILLLVLALVMGIWWLLPARTSGISSDSGRAYAAIEYVELGGIEQCVLIRTHDLNNSVLLFLHGGPGMPMMYLAHTFQRPLEEDFTVVQWDRRAAGKTFSRNKAAANSLTDRQLLDDAFALIDTLRNRYQKDRIVLAGHSFGACLGSMMVNERPDLFELYFSIGQVVDAQKARILQKEFILNEAKRAGRQDILDSLRRHPNRNLENWLFEFGGELKNSRSFWPLLRAGLKAPEYTLADAINVGKGSAYSSANMKYTLLEQPIGDSILNYQVPVYFLVGRHDYTTPHALIQEYYEKIEAPDKTIVYFEESAHFPFFEEPDRFCAEVKRLYQKRIHPN